MPICSTTKTSAAIDTTYLAGMAPALAPLPAALLWTPAMIELRRPRAWRAPSWSPLSLDGMIAFPHATAIALIDLSHPVMMEVGWR